MTIIKNIDGTDYDIVPGKPDPNVSKLLEDLVEKNNRGEIKALAYAVVYPDDTTEKNFVYSGFVAPALMVGALEFTKEYVMRHALRTERDDITIEE